MTACPRMSNVIQQSKSPSAAAAFRHPSNPRLSMLVQGNTITNVGRNVGNDSTQFIGGQCSSKPE